MRNRNVSEYGVRQMNIRLPVFTSVRHRALSYTILDCLPDRPIAFAADGAVARVTEQSDKSPILGLHGPPRELKVPGKLSEVAVADHIDNARRSRIEPV